jgi:hypothetical protein
MPKLSDEEWAAKVHQWQQAGGFEKGHGGAIEDDSLGGQLLGGAKAMIGGVGKELAGLPAPPGGVTPGVADPELGKWAASEDPQHPTMEGVGRFGADIAPSLATPELGLLNAARAVGLGGQIVRHPQIAKTIMRGTQDLWKGAVGGVEQSPDDPAQGAETGTATAIGQKALGLVPWRKAAHGLGLAGEVLSHGHNFMPWWAMYHMGGPLAALARYVKYVNPGVAGASVERAVKAGQDDAPQNR